MTNAADKSEIMKTIHEWIGENQINRGNLADLIWALAMDATLFENFRKAVMIRRAKIHAVIEMNPPKPIKDLSMPHNAELTD